MKCHRIVCNHCSSCSVPRSQLIDQSPFWVAEVLKLEEKGETTSEAEQTGGDVFLPYANAFAASVASAAVVADEQQQRAAMQQVAASLREKMRASCRKWREKNRQRCSEYFRQYREKRKASQVTS